MESGLSITTSLVRGAVLSLTIVSFLSGRINPREPKMELKLEHDTPALVNEFFKLKLKVKSLEDEADPKDLK